MSDKIQVVLSGHPPHYPRTVEGTLIGQFAVVFNDLANCWQVIHFVSGARIFSTHNKSWAEECATELSNVEVDLSGITDRSLLLGGFLKPPGWEMLLRLRDYWEEREAEAEEAAL